MQRSTSWYTSGISSRKPPIAAEVLRAREQHGRGHRGHLSRLIVVDVQDRGVVLSIGIVPGNPTQPEHDARMLNGAVFVHQLGADTAHRRIGFQPTDHLLEPPAPQNLGVVVQHQQVLGVRPGCRSLVAEGGIVELVVDTNDGVTSSRLPSSSR